MCPAAPAEAVGMAARRRRPLENPSDGGFSLPSFGDAAMPLRQQRRLRPKPIEFPVCARRLVLNKDVEWAANVEFPDASFKARARCAHAAGGMASARIRHKCSQYRQCFVHPIGRFVAANV